MELTPLVGERMLDRYRIVEQHTEGGFGTVSICWDEKLKRRVAIKTIPLTTEAGVPLSDAMPEALAEARTASFLTHPCIVPMLDFEVDPYKAYLIMEYIDGCTLHDLIEKDGPLPFDEVAHLLDSLAEALTFAHENGVLHLDIKPANILIDKSGNVKLGDFGMANLASAAGYLGARGGTVGYMAPEQLEGRTVDDRSDVFALAAVIYEALCGFAPFKAATPEESLAHIFEGAPYPSSLDSDIDLELDDILLEALSPYPDHRPETVSELAEAALPLLGNPREGRISLADAVEDYTDDTPEEWLEDNAAFDTGQLSVLKTPEAHQAFGKVANALIFGWGGWLAASSWPLHSHTVVAFVMGFLTALMGALLPQLAFPVVVVLLGVSMGVAGLPWLGVLFAVPLLLYWFVSARNHSYELSVTMMPALLGTLGFNWFLPFIASWKLQPHKAVITTAFAGFLAFFLSAATQGVGLEYIGPAFLPVHSGNALLENVGTLVKSPSTWIIFAGWVITAAIIATTARTAKRMYVIMGAVLGVIVNYLFAMAAKGMELGSFPAVIGPQTAIALLISFILYVCIYLLFGLPDDSQGDFENFDA